MYFKDIKPESSIYVYNRKETTLQPARVVSVSTPHLDSNMRQQQSYNNAMQMYVDVVLDINGNTTAPYVCPENSEIVYAGDLVMTPDITPILREIESAKNTAQQSLAQREALEERVKKCDELLAQYNPAFREKREMDSRLTKVEGAVGRIEEMFEKFMSQWDDKK